LDKYPDLKDPRIDEIAKRNPELRAAIAAGLEWEARFLLMVDHWNLQTDAISNCNKQLQSARDWIDKHAVTETSYDTRGGVD
jgi:hypothetical protein